METIQPSSVMWNMVPIAITKPLSSGHSTDDRLAYCFIARSESRTAIVVSASGRAVREVSTTRLSVAATSAAITAPSLPITSRASL